MAAAVALLFCLSSGDFGRAAENPPAAHHAHAAGAGVRSLDVYAEGGQLHLLTGETGVESDRALLWHRRSDDGGVTWSAPVQVDLGLPAAFSLHRGMDAQIAAAGNRVIAIWTTAGTDQWGSGPLATALSADGGKTWQGGPNPADDGSTTGHGFIDVAAGEKGVFHLTWLDSRDGRQGLRYARSTDGGRSWSANVTAKAGTCECCANAIAPMANGEAAILFRDHEPRDMRLVRSSGGGTMWSAPIAAGEFDWKMEGCPHVGGGLAFTEEGLRAFHMLAWTGKAERAGIYYVRVPESGSPSGPRRLGDTMASHPDLAAGPGDRLAAVWDSHAGEPPGIWGSVAQGGGQKWSNPRRLSPMDASASHPRVVSTAHGFRVFWTEDRAGKPTAWATAELQ